MIPTGKVVYLPSEYDPKKVREGIREIFYLVKLLDDADKRSLDTAEEKKDVS